MSLWKSLVAGAALVGLLAVALLVPPGAAAAGPKRSTSSALEERVRLLEEEVRRLRAERAVAPPATRAPSAVAPSAVAPSVVAPAAAAPAAADEETAPVDKPTVEALIDDKLRKQKVLAGWQDGFFLQSPSGDFKLKLRGYAQADARFFPWDSGDTGNDSFFLRRVRPIVEGTVYKYFDFRIMPDFGGGQTTLQDGYLDVRYFPLASLRAGKFKEPLSLERLQSGSELLFIERSISQNLAPNRDVGFELFGEAAGGALEYQLGLFNGVFDGGSSDGDGFGSGKDFVGRVFARPFKSTDLAPLKGLGIGIAGSYGDQGQDDLKGLRFQTAGRSTFFRYVDTTNPVAKGTHWRLSPQLYHYWGPFGLMGEYIASQSSTGGTVEETATEAEANNWGWFLQASWVLTGEDASYKGVVPIDAFDPRQGRWGAFELAARVSNIDIDNDALDAGLARGSDEAWAYTAGVNWYLNRAVKIQFNWEHTDFAGGPSFSGEGRRDHEDVLLTRFQLAY